MTDNEMQSVDLVVGPLDNFDDAVAFGDALYGLEGVTRLALNEFEGSRASFTFTARSLEALTESLWRMPEFAVGAVERAVDGTLQVRLGGNAAAQAPEAIDSPEPALPAEEPVADALSQPSSDPFARVEAPAEPPIEQAWTAEPAVPAALVAEGLAAPSSERSETAFPESPPFTVEAMASAEARVPDWPPQDSGPVMAEPPTPLFAAIESFGPAPGADEDDAGEVARIIEKLASELRETAQHLSELAAGVAPVASHEDAAEEAPDWQPQPTELPWNREPAADADPSPPHDLPPLMTPEELDGIAASESWDSEQAAGEPTLVAPPAQQPAAEAPQEEEKGWEAPRMPGVGAVPAIGGEQASEFKSEAHNAQTIALATAMGRRPSQVQLMASGFASFGIANSFIAAVRQIPGVRNVAIAELDQGRLKLTLDYFGSDGLEAQLQQLRDFPHQVVRASSKEIEIQLMAA